MNLENALAWTVIGVVAIVALWLKGYIPLTMPWAKSLADPLISKAEGMAISELEQLASAMILKAKEVAEKDLTAAKVEEVTQALLAHFKAPTPPTGNPPASPPLVR